MKKLVAGWRQRFAPSRFHANTGRSRLARLDEFGIIGGPCNPDKHNTLPAMARLPQVVSLIGKKHPFVIHERMRGATVSAAFYRVVVSVP